MKSLLKSCAFMVASSGKTGVLAHARTLLTLREWVYVLSLLVPLFIYNVALKVVRIVTQFEPPGPVGFVDQLRSDVLFNLGYAIFWICVFAAVRRRAARLATLVVFHLAAIVVVALTTSAHVFYQKTGSTLDLSFVLASLSSLGDIKGVIASETSVSHWVLVCVLLLYAAVGPATLTRFATGGWPVLVQTASRPGPATVTAGLAALLLFSLSLLPSATGAGNAFSRDALANMIVGNLGTPEIETELAAGDMPTQTRLVQTSQTEPRNVVVVFLESTRARSTTPYQQDLGTTPFLNKLSRQSVMAERAYAVVPHTSKALVASLCGVAPPLDTDNTESEPDVIPARCLADLLKEEGYSTAFFQSATEKFERRRMLVDNLGYRDFFAMESMDKEGFDKVNYFGYEDNIMLESSRDWLKENGDGPFLATYLTVTPHHNYVVPDRYGTKDFAEDEVLNKYLNTVRYQDFFLRNLFEQYKRMGVYEDTLFIVLGDHGEGFEEHGLKQHDNTIYNEGLRIPFLIHDPRHPEARRLERPVNQLDLLPTVAHLLGYGVRGGSYPGAPMLDLPSKERTLMASCYHERTCLASITGDEKYIYNYGNKGDEYYHLSEDPYERHNVIKQQDAERLKALRNDLLAWEAKVKALYEQRLESEETGSSE